MKALEKQNQVRRGVKQTLKQVLDRHLFPLQEEMNQTLLFILLLQIICIVTNPILSLLDLLRSNV